MQFYDYFDPSPIASADVETSNTDGQLLNSECGLWCALTFAKVHGLAQHCLAEPPNHGIFSWIYSSKYEFPPVEEKTDILSENNCYP